jgi:hypothetical protein
MFEHDTRRPKSIDNISFALLGVVFCLDFGRFFLFLLLFSCLVFFFYLFIYLFIDGKSHKKGPPNLVGWNQTPIVLYFILLAKH